MFFSRILPVDEVFEISFVFNFVRLREMFPALSLRPLLSSRMYNRFFHYFYYK